MAERLLRTEIALPNVDAFVTRLWGSVGRLLLAWPTIACLGLVAVGGLLALLVSDHLAAIKPVNLFAARSGSMVLAIALFVPLLIFAHELAHALVCKSFGREVRRGGFALYFGIPVFFVDTTDIWLEDRWRRIAVSSAGPVSDLVMAGACSLLALVLPTQAASTVLFLAGIAYFVLLCNLVPLLELDGYYVLVDLLEVPRLRPRSFAFVREKLPGKLWRGERFTHEELLFTLYGVLAGTFSVLMFLYAARLLEAQLVGLVSAIAVDGSWFLVPIVVLLAMTVGASMLLRAMGTIEHAVRLAWRGARASDRRSRRDVRESSR